MEQILKKIKDLKIEVLQIICLDKNKQVINDSVIIEGDDNFVQFDYKKIAQYILKFPDAKYFVLNHNHPGQKEIQFSKADENIAYKTAMFGEMLDVILDDFYITTETDCLSLKKINPKALMPVMDSRIVSESLFYKDMHLYRYLLSNNNKFKKVINKYDDKEEAEFNKISKTLSAFKENSM